MVYGIFVWFVIIQVIRLSLKWFLLYKGWMFENPHLRPLSKASKLWLVSWYFASISYDFFFHSNVAGNDLITLI